TAAASSAAAGYGMSYNPYTSDGQCKLQDEVNSDIDILSDYTTIRIYGTDCNQTKTVPHAVAQHPGMKLMMGLSNSDLSDVSSAVDLIIAGVNAELNSSWDRIDTVTVGNEAVTGGAASVSDVVSALNSARTKLRNAKPNAYTGPVVTVEQVGAILDSADGSGLQLCQNSDYTAANCHAFFDTSGDYTTGTRAGDFVGMQYERLVKGCGKERTVITESGWPWNTEWPLTDFADTDPIPSTENQEEAMKSLKKLFKSNPQDVVLFSAFDDAWKPNFDGSKGAEGYWGVHH
ncbi:glycoside hydrolase family 17 protein, partial [Saccharata proteae CBS 121410]